MIVPSEWMLDVLLRCYPVVARDRIHIIPWGVVAINEPVVPNWREEFVVSETLCIFSRSAWTDC